MTDLIFRVLAAADIALSPHDVHGRAEIVHATDIAIVDPQRAAHRVL